jgi:hypothetical protein
VAQLYTRALGSLYVATHDWHDVTGLHSRESAPYRSFSGLSPTGLMTIFYCFYDSPNLKGQIPVFISFRNRVAQLYPQAMGSSSQRQVQDLLRPTVNRPVRLGVGPPLGAHDQILNFILSDNCFLSSSCIAPSLTRRRVCNLQCNHAQVRVAQDP